MGSEYISHFNWKKIFTSITILAVIVLLLAYQSPQFSRRQFELSLTNHSSVWLDKIRQSQLKDVRSLKADKKPHTSSYVKGLSFPEDTFARVNFDINGSDVLVFLHMQKTGGSTFGRHLVSNLDLRKECDILEQRKRRNCLRPNSDVESWLFSRYSTGWACGLHSDWTELHGCIADKITQIEKIHRNRSFFYITILRDPVKRFLSEWKHVQRGATWRTSTFSCNGKQTPIPKCYTGYDWRGVSLQDFISCPLNMAKNRQTRMLADLRLVNCYQRWLNNSINTTEIERLENLMLESAKKNLKDMTFFGLLEEQTKLQKLFEFTFPFKFKEDFVQFNVTRISDFVLTSEEMERIRKSNKLDMKLYEYAKQLFDQRCERNLS